MKEVKLSSLLAKVPKRVSNGLLFKGINKLKPPVLRDLLKLATLPIRLLTIIITMCCTVIRFVDNKVKKKFDGRLDFLLFAVSGVLQLAIGCAIAIASVRLCYLAIMFMRKVVFGLVDLMALHLDIFFLGAMGLLVLLGIMGIYNLMVRDRD